MESKGRGVLDTRRSLSSGGHSADPVAGMTALGGASVIANPGQHPSKSALAPMVNRVLTSPYLWWFVRSPAGSRIPRPLLKVLAFQTWL
jgi:hypothetical protein